MLSVLYYLPANAFIHDSNVLRTNGIDLEFVFLKPPYPSINPKTPAKYRNWLVHGSHRCTIWGVDPGETDLFVAADGSSTNPHRYRRTSTNEYYNLCGSHIAKEKRDHFRRNAHPDTIQMIDGIESLKTADVEILRHAIQYRMQNFDVITFYYDQGQRFCKLKMKSYQGRQQALDEIARRLTYGSKKYGLQPKPMHQHMVSPIPRRRQSWTPISSCDQPQETIAQHYVVAIGNGAWGSKRGKRPAPVKKLRHHLHQVSRRNVHLSVIIIDEYMTSQVCAECHQKSLIHMKTRMPSNVSTQPSMAAQSNIHAVLKCTSCSVVWNRDEMAAKNIRYLFEYMATHNDERPHVFTRPSTNAEEDTGPRRGRGSVSAS